MANTSELPTRKRDLVTVLAHYRHALHDLATQTRDYSEHPRVESKGFRAW